MYPGPAAERQAIVTIACDSIRSAVIDMLKVDHFTVLDTESVPGTPVGYGDGRCSLCILDFESYRAIPRDLRHHRFPTDPATAGCRATILLCLPGEYPDVPHDRFDFVMVTPLRTRPFHRVVNDLFSS